MSLNLVSHFPIQLQMGPPSRKRMWYVARPPILNFRCKPMCCPGGPEEQRGLCAMLGDGAGGP